MTEMNVYIYGGKTRSSAYVNLTMNNTQAELGTVYNVSAIRGIVLVAYPNQDKETEFAFNFWADAEKVVDPDEELKPGQWWEFEGKTGETVFSVLGAIAIIMMSVTCILCFYNCFLKCKLRKMNS